MGKRRQNNYNDNGASCKFYAWMRLAKKLDLKMVVLKPSQDGVLNPNTFFNAVDDSTKFVAFQHVSNSMGTIHPVKEIIKAVKKKNSSALVYIDGSQGPGHLPVDVNDLGCDFYGFSGHKGPLGPQGTGGLFVKKELIKNMAVMELGEELLLMSQLMTLNCSLQIQGQNVLMLVHLILPD